MLLRTINKHAVLGLILGMAILLRLWALLLFAFPVGDVNLFCLAAENWADQGKLTVGFKNHYSREMLPYGLNEPQSQHLPLWPLLGGISKSLFPHVDVFTILKVWSFFFGLVLIILLYYFSRTALPSSLNLIPSALASFSPLLIEYSVDGSFYILAACEWLALFLVLPSLCRNRGWRWAALGLLLGLSLLTHFTQVVMLPACLVFFFQNRNQLSWSGIIVSFLIAAAIFSPWAVRNLSLFGSPFYSSTTLNFYEKWGLMDLMMSNGQLVEVPRSLLSSSVLGKILYAAPLNAWAFLSRMTVKSLLWPFVAVGVAFWSSARKHIVLPGGWPALVLLGLYLIDIAVWGFIRERFIVPMLPWVFLWATSGLASMGMMHPSLKPIEHHLHWATTVVVLITCGIFVGQLFWENKLSSNLVDREQAEKLALWLQEQPLGIVLGYSSLLDGGIESIRTHRQPFVHGRKFIGKPGATMALLDQYKPRYIWADSLSRGFLEKLVPVNLVQQQGHFCILELSAVKAPASGQ